MIDFEKRLNKNKYLAFCDVETSGFDPIRNDLIQLAVIITDDKLEILAEFNQFCAPKSEKHWTWGAENIHKITLAEAKTYQSQRQLCINFLNFLLPYKHKKNLPLKFVYHAHRLFDYNFVEWLFRKEDIQYSFWKVFNSNFTESTIHLAEKFKPVTGLSDNKLATLADHFNIELDHHEALSDVNACLEIYKKFKEYEKGNEL